jgi:hypothetical protein
VLPELRDACARAVAELVRADPEVIVVVGPAAETAEWDPESRPDLSPYAPALGPGGRAGLPLSLGLGALLLDQAGYTGRRVLQAVAGHEPARACTALGAQWAATATGTGATAMLAMGDGSARRSTAAPGYLDERAVPFDTAVEDAVRAGDLAALADVDPALARDLMATGRPAWQVLAGALGPAQRPATDILYADAPFGVAYLIAVFTPAEGQAESGRARIRAGRAAARRTGLPRPR